MAVCSNLPLVKRRTITLDERRVIRETNVDSGLKIIRSSRHSAARNADSLEDSAQENGLPEAALASATVLVVNASQEVAGEITAELSSALPGCTILFAPTLGLALWILKRRSIDLILSSAVLPDGSLSKLHELLELLDPPPELVVMSGIETTRSQLGAHPGYRFVELRRLTNNVAPASLTPDVSRSICELGADLRNDLNNPLQEIVAMAFVAQTSPGLSPVAEQALSAIERAAGSLATVVGSLEDKIRGVVVNAA